MDLYTVLLQKHKFPHEAVFELSGHQNKNVYLCRCQVKMWVNYSLVYDLLLLVAQINLAHSSRLLFWLVKTTAIFCCK